MTADFIAYARAHADALSPWEWRKMDFLIEGDGSKQGDGSIGIVVFSEDNFVEVVWMDSAATDTFKRKDMDQFTPLPTLERMTEEMEAKGCELGQRDSQDCHYWWSGATGTRWREHNEPFALFTLRAYCAMRRGSK